MESVCESAFKILNRIFSVILNFVGPFLVTLCCLLITGIVFVHYSVVVPFYTSYWTLSGILHFVISTFITVNIVYNYYKAVTTSPGSPPQVQLTAEQLEKLRNEPTPQRGQGFSRFCKVCKNLKCPRAHHCHMCSEDGSSLSSNFHIPWNGMLPRIAMISSFLVTLGVILGVGTLLFWQVYLLLTGQTTIEFHYNQKLKWQAKHRGEVFVNPYHLGVSRNFRLFFGTDNSRWWFSWLLPDGTKIPGDGTHFTTIHDLRQLEPHRAV